jgi:hypothetical protein
MLRHLSQWVRPWIRVLLALVSLWPALGLGVDKGRVEDEPDEPKKKRPLIEGYEPNYLGYTWQEDDVSFIDIGISLKYPLLPDHFARWRGCEVSHEKLDPECAGRWRAYLTFTGRSGFYAFSRDSGPVIAKTFNPKLLLRWTPRIRDARTFASTTRGDQQEYWRYVDLAYAHESNGQSIDTPEEYFVERRQSSDPRFALDKVSRGWDYVQVVVKQSILTAEEDTGHRVAAFLDLKYFMPNGLFQGTPEEYHSWENDPDAKRRRAVNGIAATVEYEMSKTLCYGRDCRNDTFSDPRVLVKYETGYDPLLKYSTVRIELGVTFIELPIAIWYQNGYNNSLARYYEKSSAVGIELRIAE